LAPNYLLTAGRFPQTMLLMTTELTQMPFGDSLRRWRQNQRLSQAGFGELLAPKVRHSTVSCWEKGLRRPSWRFLAQILAITGISPNVALGTARASKEDT